MLDGQPGIRRAGGPDSLQGLDVQALAELARMLQLLAVYGLDILGGHTLITATLRIDAAKAKQKEITRLLRSLIGPTRVETGCISCRLYGELDNPSSVTWMEEWRTENDLKRHLRSPQYRKILIALDMADAEPEVRFDTVVETAGMQLIAEARGVATGN